jgi:ACR3 family arsenite efflux pump ArsB
MKLTCQHCGGQMVRKTLTSGNCLGVAIALALFAFGAALTATIAGALIGIPLMLCALFIGGKRRRVWRCRRCASVLDRA